MTSFTLPLYDESGMPLWEQQAGGELIVDTDNWKVRKPDNFDIARIPVPKEHEPIYPLICGSDNIIDARFFNIGTNLSVAGYPYGYSINGDEEPVPVVLTRTVAASRTMTHIVTDGVCAKGMSGSPVFLLLPSQQAWLVGIYTGGDFPAANNDRAHHRNEGAIGFVHYLAHPMRNLTFSR
ncbi:serine protease [Aquabacterium sp. J223]|uniref:serine protease n=1 Tax=Aquabacterium sp. J223 TaxID=2898431 RepID=UPI0021AD63B5|nr:serine protease [Aquabacterium sp. J223]UUX97463.1 serine protease [Aquabacterium sp. J223]